MVTTSTKPKPIQLPKLHLPTFDGNLMNWSQFWGQFQIAVDSNADLSSEHKLAYLRDAIKDPSVKSLLFSGAEQESLYEEAVEILQERFDKKRTVHAHLCQQLIDLPHAKANKADLLGFVDNIKQTLAGLRHTGQCDFPSYLTSMMVPRIPKSLQVEWEVHSKESRGVPPIDDFLKFVSFRADVHLQLSSHLKLPLVPQTADQLKMPQ